MKPFSKYTDDKLVEAAKAVLNEGKDPYVMMKELEKHLKDIAGDIRNFHAGHEEDAIKEISSALYYCHDLAEKIRREF